MQQCGNNTMCTTSSLGVPSNFICACAAGYTSANNKNCTVAVPTCGGQTCLTGAADCFGDNTVCCMTMNPSLTALTCSNFPSQITALLVLWIAIVRCRTTISRNLYRNAITSIPPGFFSQFTLMFTLYDM